MPGRFDSTPWVMAAGDLVVAATARHLVDVWSTGGESPQVMTRILQSAAGAAAASR